MHELSIAVSLVDAICDELPRLGAVRVATVNVRVGALSGVVSEALAFAFDVVIDGTLIAGAGLHIERTDGRELELMSLEVIDAAEDCGSS
jgi:hydrogenase nickel incorporation protein HypA/HybF